MAVELATAYISIVPSMRGVKREIQKGLGDPARQGKQYGNRFGGAFRNAMTRISGRALAIGTGALVGSIGLLTTSAVKKFGELEDAVDATEVVFGKSFDKIAEAAETAGRRVGLSQIQYLQTTQQMGIFGKAAGLTGRELANFSIEITDLAGDLASFKGVEPQTAIDALTSAMAGETEPIRRFGVLMDAQTLKQEAFKLGLIETTKGALDPNIRALAVQSLVMKQTTDAQGDFQRTIDSTANTQKLLNLEFEDTQALIGEKLAPTFNAMRESAIKFLQGVQDKLPKFIDDVKKAVQALQDFVQWIKDNAVIITGLTGTVTALVVAYNAATIATYAGVVALEVWSTAAAIATGATRALGAAIRFMLGPVGWIITAIGLLVTGIIWLYQNNETAKRIIDGAWAAIKDAVKAAVDWVMNVAWPAISSFVGAIVGWFRDTLAPAVSSVWNGIVDVVKAVIDWFAKYVVPPIKFVVGLVIGYYKLLWNVVKTVFNAIVGPIKSFVDWFVTYVWPKIEVILLLFRAAFIYFYRKVIKPVWEGFKDAVGKVVDWFLNTVVPWFKGAIDNIKKFFNDFKLALKFVWEFIKSRIIKPVVDWIMKYVVGTIRTALDWLNEKWNEYLAVLKHVWGIIQRNIIQPFVDWFNSNILPHIRKALDWLKEKWETFKTNLKVIWKFLKEKVINPVVKWFEEKVLPKIEGVLDKIKEGFENAKNFIGDVWETIKELVAVPINFVIDDIYNQKIAEPWNKVASFVSDDENALLPTFDKISFATGGVLPGYTPGRDIHNFFSPTGGSLALSGGEAIMRPEWTRAVGGPAAVASMNSAAKHGRAFKEGGVLDKIFGGFKSAGAWLAGQISPIDAMKNLFDGAKKLFSGIPGADGIANLGGDFLRKIISSVKDFGVGFISDMFAGPRTEKGASLGPGLGMGWQAMVAILKRYFPSLGITSTYRPGAVTAVGTPSYHGMGRAVDMAPRMEVFNWLSRNYPQSRELIFTPGGSRQIWNGRNFSNFAPVTKADHYDHIHWAMRSGGVLPNAGVFDSGGVLPKGRSVVDNRTGRPEPLYTAQQMAQAGKVEIGTLVAADPRAAIREVEDMQRRAAVRARLRGVR